MISDAVRTRDADGTWYMEYEYWNGEENVSARERTSSNKTDIKKGDIVVVTGHVGIAVSGSKVIDASSSNGKVVERSMGNWWRNNFIVAWRIFD